MATQKSRRHDSSSRPQLRRRAIELWMVALLFTFLLIPVYLVYLSIERDVDRLNADYQIVQQTLTAMGTPDPEKQALKKDLTQVQSAIALIKGASSDLEDRNVDWPAVMVAIKRYNPIQITLDSVRQSDERLILEGHAVDDSVVIAYSNRLKENDLFADVTVRSLETVATPFATPSATSFIQPGPTETPTITPTPTPDPSDHYEVDDFDPQPIFLNQVQTHNFYPIHDVDQVVFLAKAGRYYRVSTFDLALGVDTFLTVFVDDETYTNDDRQPGELGSEVTFQAPEGKATDVLIQITNHRHYGPDKGYSIVVREFVPTATPTATETPTPSSTPTPTPTFTPQPVTDTPTPSPPTETPTPTPTLPTSTPILTPTLTPTFTPTFTVTPTSGPTDTSRLPGLARWLLRSNNSLMGKSDRRFGPAPSAQAIRFVIVLELTRGAQ
jgi:hypothetical protein